MRTLIRVAVSVLALSSVSLAWAAECDVQVSSAIESERENYINGVAGLASSNYSSRPGSFTSMACLDQFMQGGMDIFFRPPDLDSLLQQVLSFACEQISGGGQGQSGGMGGGAPDLMALVKGFSGGLTVPSTNGGSMPVNMSDYFGNMTSPKGTNLQGIFGGGFQ